MIIQYTRYASLYDIDTHESVTESWADFVRGMSTHLRIPAKDRAPGFGPYALRPPDVACYKHKDGLARTGPHRCDACVPAITLAVFDVDHGTADAVRGCEAALEAAGVARHWYSSYSHMLNRGPAYRLVMPVSEPIAPALWPEVRAGIMARYRIPADAKACSGKSHFYYVPSAPLAAQYPTLTPEAWTRPGNPLAVRSFLRPGYVPPRKRPAVADDEYEFPSEPATPHPPEYVQSLKDRLLAAAARKARNTNPGERKKAEELQRLVRGEPLAGHGDRDNATLRTTGVMAHVLHGESLGTLLALIEPSIEAMIADGSSVTLDAAERGLLTGMRSAHFREEQNRKIMRALDRGINAALGRQTGP